MQQNSSAQAPDDEDRCCGAAGLDIFVDQAHRRVSADDLHRIVGRMFDGLEWGSLQARIVVIVPDDLRLDASFDPRVRLTPAAEAAAAFRHRCRELQTAPRDVIVCFGDFLPSMDVIGRLRETLQQDPMAGAAFPRIALGPLGHLVILGDQSESGTPALVDRKQSAVLPPTYYLPEDLYPCFCIKRDMLANIDPYDEFETFPASVLTFLAAARRRGFLVVVDNRAVLPVSDYDFDRRAILTEIERVQRRIGEHALVSKRLTKLAAIAEERRMRVSDPARDCAPPSLLLDCSNVGPVFNGTAECVLGIMTGISSIDTADWNISAMFSAEARRFFHIDVAFPTIRIVDSSDTCLYDVALRLSQAWLLQTIRDLSRRGRSIALTILDVIATDIVYPAPDGSDETFQFVGEHADGIAYISEFSQRQFRRRYYTSPDVIEAVIHLSLDPADYMTDPVPDPADAEWILVFGNAYDHKDLPRTIEILATAFPFERFKVVGIDKAEQSNVEALRSGELHKSIVNDCFRRAKCVVFPSFYEGFGLPILSGLAHGKTVVARRSELLHEVAPLFPDVGRLIEFSNSLELVPIVGEVLGGAKYPSVPLGVKLNELYGWSECGSRVFEFVKQLRASEKPDRWRQRDRALQYVFAAR